MSAAVLVVAASAATPRAEFDAWGRRLTCAECGDPLPPRTAKPESKTGISGRPRVVCSAECYLDRRNRQRRGE